jgi:beta-phosphoglucomutase-like phosphatase (HAD superfamily)
MQDLFWRKRESDIILMLLDGNDVTNAKPDPVFLIAAKLLDVNPENAIVLKIL